MTTFSKAVENCVLSRQASRYSPHTICDYQNTYAQFAKFLDGDPNIGDITATLIAQFLASKTELSDKTLLNYHTGLSSLWSWAKTSGLVEANIVRLVAPPKPIEREIIPLSHQEIERLLKAARLGKFALRDQSIVLILLDTGIRASELCNLRLKDFDWKNNRVLILGKGKKERLLKFSPGTKESLTIYLRQKRGITNYANVRKQPMYMSSQDNSLSRSALTQLMRRLRNKAGVLRCHAHLFRHTFAIEFLRNGGDIYTLQKILGHASLDMVKRYLKIAQIDMDRVHEMASPVTNWHLDQR